MNLSCSLVLATALGFLVVGCGDDSGSGGSSGKGGGGGAPSGGSSGSGGSGAGTGAGDTGGSGGSGATGGSGGAGTGASGGAGGGGGDDLAALSDEFDDGATKSQWLRIWETESWPHDQLEIYDIDQTRAGFAVLVPFTSTWFENYRGELTYKEVTGDFVATARIEPRNRAGTGAPAGDYSLAGVMVRAPRNITAQTWVPGGENYVFLAAGSSTAPGQYQVEVKTTRASVSNLEVTDTGLADVDLRAARVGEYMLMLLRATGGSWAVHRRYRREDFPATLQVGMTTYTNWSVCSTFSAEEHNNTLIAPPTYPAADPDLLGQYDFFRFERPVVPPSWLTSDLSNASEVSDAEVLSVLGAD